MRRLGDLNSAFRGLRFLGSGGLEGQVFLGHREDLARGFLEPIKRRRLIHDDTIPHQGVT